MHSRQDVEIVIVGRLGAPHGVGGWLHVNSFTDPPGRLFDYSPLRLGGAGKEPAGPWRSVEVSACRAHRQGYVVRLEGVSDRTAAEALRGHWIAIDAAQLPPPGPDEYYWRDLIGIEVRDQHGRTLGRVGRFFETGANDVMVVVDEEGGEMLIPFHRSTVRAVDLAGGRLDVDWTPE